MAEQKLGNPAVVGLAGFGLTTMVLQFHNVGWIGLGPVVWLGLIFGGLAQMIAGLQEMKTGNNFGYCAFTGYGCFWIALTLLLLGNHYNIYTSSKTDVGWFLIAWTLFTVDPLDWCDARQQRPRAHLHPVADRLHSARPRAFRLSRPDGGGRLRVDGDRGDGVVHHGAHHLCRSVWPGHSSGRQAVDQLGQLNQWLEAI
jgi:hypothetical protein